MCYGIWCEVWGGQTGSRAAWLKSDGKMVVYETKAEAEARAAFYNDLRNNGGNFYGTATFRYTARAI